MARRLVVARRLCWRAVHWFSTALLIVLTAGTAAWTGWLLRRLFVVDPAASAAPAGPGEPTAEEPTA